MHDNTSTTEANMVEMNETNDSPEEAYLRKTMFYVLIDNGVTGLTIRFVLLRSWLKILFFYIPQCVKVS